MRIASFLLMAFLVIGCVRQPAVKEVSFTTDDGFVIFGDYYEGGEKAVMLLHMLDSSRESWNGFAEKLNENNYTVLAIDMRGHGQSTMQYGSRRTWRDFTADDFNNAVLDLKSADNFLQERNKTKIATVGASIGANIAVNYAVGDENAAAVVALSPGMDYRGVEIDYVIRNFKKPIMLVAAEGDTYSADAAKFMYFHARGTKTLFIFNETSAHGTDMLNGTGVDAKIMIWLEENLA